MKNPIATMFMKNGAKIVIELLPEAAPNTVNSFIHLAGMGCYDGHAIERIVPGNWVDASYSAFGKEYAKYLIPFESQLHPEIEPLDSHPGCICMGGYSNGLAGGEFFFPTRDCPDHKGRYPVFGRVLEGFEEVKRLEAVPTVNVQMKPIEINRPLEPQVIEKVTVETFGAQYPKPIVLEGAERPDCWK